MSNESSTIWHQVFSKWPASLPRRGVVVSTINEVTPFKSFLLRGDTLLLERTNPDALGARFVVMGFDAIHLLKLIDPVKEEIFTSAGFVGHFAKM
jgi:hypothetical protein